MRRPPLLSFGLMAAIMAGLSVLTMPAGARAAGDAGSPLGLWLTEKQGIMVELFPCQDEVCGRIVWLRKDYWRSGELRRDRHNPDPALRNRPWCGSVVIEGMEHDGNGGLENGRVYSPRDGGTYRLDLENKGDDTLQARAYLGIRLLGRSETWTRPAPDQAPGCPPAG